MAIKKNTFITAELDWAEEQLAKWKGYIDSNPMDLLVDRLEWKETANSRIPQVVATKENQGKFIQETMKNFLALLEVINNLREKEAIAKEARGGAVVPHRMK